LADLAAFVMGELRMGSRGWSLSILCLAALSVFFPRPATAENASQAGPPGTPFLPGREAAAAFAEERPLRDTIAQLADKDDVVRQKALYALAQSRDGRLSDLLKQYIEGSLYLWNGRPVVGQPALEDDNGKRVKLFDPLMSQPLLQNGRELVLPLKQLKNIELPRSERGAVNAAMQALAMWSSDSEKRLSAIHRAGDWKVVESLPELDEIRNSDAPPRIRRAARESIDLIRLSGTFPDGVKVDRLEAARDLGSLHSARGSDALKELLKEMDKDSAHGRAADEANRGLYQQSIQQIDRYQNVVAAFDCLKNGLSRGSILVLMALGLAITFGSMGVINMAHGEMMMIGAFTTFSVQQLFMRYVSASLFNWYYVAALPASFLVAALFGYLIEMVVVRHLYGRPLETLLATFGVSLILIQGVQAVFGYNIGVNAPTWFQGSIEVMPDMVLPFNRCFIILLCACCVLLFYFIMNYTKLGLRMRATTQNREMAAALGVNTRWIDGCTFALGSGLAGLAGYGLTLTDGVTPDMGKNYIVESFLVVVTGGVGELAGTVYAGMGLGLLNKIFEPFAGAVWGMVLLLAAVVLFIQIRPAGLFPPRGRQADV
jgi:urea transport system permease protein